MGSTAPPTTPRATQLGGMACLDTSGNPRIPILMEMVASLSRATEAREVLHAVSEGLLRLMGPQGYVSLSTRGLQRGEYKITRLLAGDDSGQAMGTANPWQDWSQLPVHRDGFFGQLIRQAYPEVIQNFYLRDDPVVGDALSRYGSLMAIPLFDGGEPLNWSITLREGPNEFTVQELEETILRANLGGAAVKNTIMTAQLREAHRQIRNEMDQIASIQRALLPKHMPDIPGVTVTASYETYDLAGGDYYDFFPLGRHVCPQGSPISGPWGLLIADAAGHGPAAAVLMAMLHSILHAYPKEPDSPAEVLAHANDHLFRKGIASSFVTAFFAIYDPDTRRLSYARAGHPPPLLKHAGAGGAVERLDCVGGVPLGVIDDAEYENASRTLEPGQTLVLYTDGITEAMSPDREMFTVAGIEEALHMCTGDPECVQGSVMTALREHEAGVRPSDDQTMVAIGIGEA